MITVIATLLGTLAGTAAALAARGKKAAARAPEKRG